MNNNDDNNEKIFEAEFQKESESISKDDIENILNKEADINKKVKSSKKLLEYLSDIKYMFSMLKDFMSGKYTNVPWRIIAGMTAALIYVFSPIDLVADFIPIVGLLDDATVIGICLKLVADDLKKYVAWKKNDE